VWNKSGRFRDPVKYQMPAYSVISCGQIPVYRLKVKIQISDYMGFGLSVGFKIFIPIILYFHYCLGWGENERGVSYVFGKDVVA